MSVLEEFEEIEKFTYCEELRLDLAEYRPFLIAVLKYMPDGRKFRCILERSFLERGVVDLNEKNCLVFCEKYRDKIYGLFYRKIKENNIEYKAPPKGFAVLDKPGENPVGRLRLTDKDLPNTFL